MCIRDRFKLPSGIGGFKELHDKMYKDIKLPKYRPYVGSALNMTSEEKQISFFNNYFVFVKITDPEPVIELATTEEKTKDDVQDIPEINAQSDLPNIDENNDKPMQDEKPKKTKNISKKPKKIKLIKKKKEKEKRGRKEEEKVGAVGNFSYLFGEQLKLVI